MIFEILMTGQKIGVRAEFTRKRYRAITTVILYSVQFSIFQAFPFKLEVLTLFFNILDLEWYRDVENCVEREQSVR